jgi:hypothetical protein
VRPTPLLTSIEILARKDREIASLGRRHPVVPAQIIAHPVPMMAVWVAGTAPSRHATPACAPRQSCDAADCRDTIFRAMGIEAAQRLDQLTS